MINSWFRFALETDPILHGTPIASLNSWKVQTRLQKDFNINRLCFTNNSTSFDPNILFVPAMNIYSTPVLSAPTVINNNPATSNNTDDYHDELPYNVYFNRNTIEQMEYYTHQAKNKLSYLYLIDMYPERIKIVADKESYIYGCYNRFES